jgi:hypothetical protein
MRIVFVALSLIFVFLVVCVGGAELFARQATARKDVQGIRIARMLNPFSSEYIYEEYQMAGDADLLIQAIRLEPTKAAYHMYYGLALLDRSPRTREGDREAVQEICKAAKLKPYSTAYRDVCAEYCVRILSSSPTQTK